MRLSTSALRHGEVEVIMDSKRESKNGFPQWIPAMDCRRCAWSPQLQTSGRSFLVLTTLSPSGQGSSDESSASLSSVTSTCSSSFFAFIAGFNGGFLFGNALTNGLVNGLKTPNRTITKK